ncbi:MAG: alpha/beta fold hydrolase [bacterium]
MVFVHGAAMDHSVWSHQSRYFAYHGYNALALDLPGHGRSGGEAARDIAQIGRWVRAIIATLRVRRIHLVGHSMGALIALEAAARFGDADGGGDGAKESSSLKLASLSLIGFAYPMAVTPQLLDAAANDPSAAYAMMTQWSHASQIGGEPVPGFWSPGMQMSLMESSRPGALLADLIACNEYDGGERGIKAVACPTLFVCGRRDKMAPAKLAQAHAARNDNAEIVFLPDCGHNLMAESPHQVLRELKRFIAASCA